MCPGAQVSPTHLCVPTPDSGCSTQSVFSECCVQEGACWGVAGLLWRKVVCGRGLSPVNSPRQNGVILPPPS